MSKGKPQLVVADDDKAVRRLLEHHGERAGFEVETYADGENAMASLSEQTEVVVLDLNMPGLDGFKCLEQLAKIQPGLPAIVLTAADAAADAVRAMKLGAVDYITKPFNPVEVIAVILKAKRLRRVEREDEDLREELGGTRPKVEMVSECREMEKIRDQAEKIANMDSTVLITGESGVGKGVLARYIHAQGQRATKPFVTVSCPALPRELLESELFGHEKGAFTGALKRRLGKIELAKGGTLFLDEIGDLPLDLQPKLLSVLQEREFQRVGGEVSIKTDVRIIAATNIDFKRQIDEGHFRQDLFYRLSVIPFEIPPLRERADEIKTLTESLLRNIAKRQKSQVTVSPKALKILTYHDWPGNVRQLENILERAAAFCENGIINESDLPGSLSGESHPDELQIDGIAGLPLSCIEAEALKQTLALCQGNKAETARRLGVTEKSIYNKMKRHGLS